MRLADIASGAIKKPKSLSYGGQVYRGKELDELIKKHANDLTDQEVKGDSAPDPSGTSGEAGSAANGASKQSGSSKSK